jgi:hypothetical protein
VLLLNVSNNTFYGAFNRIISLEPSLGISQNWHHIIINGNKIFSLSDLLYARPTASIDTLSIRDNLIYDDSYGLTGGQDTRAETIDNNVELVPDIYTSRNIPIKWIQAIEDGQSTPVEWEDT